MHHYQTRVRWTGNTGQGTARYGAYRNDHEVGTPGKALHIPGSSDPGFGGEPSRYNPEELLVATLAACHMMCYLHLCADHGVVVLDYVDEPTGSMLAKRVGGHFTEVRLRPQITLAAGSDQALALRLHEDAHARCFVANSMNFDVHVEPQFQPPGVDGQPAPSPADSSGQDRPQ